jgi:hypothetical protein
MTHPFEIWPSSGRRPLLVALIVGAIAMFVVLSALDRPLRDSDEGGIVDLEKAGSVADASRMKDAWRADGVLENAAFGLGLDYLFAPLYAAALAGACAAAAGAFRRRGRAGLARAGSVVAWMATAAALFDWIENAALAVILLDDVRDPWPGVALAAAIPKFAAVAAAQLYSAVGGLWALGSGRSA